MKLRVGFEQSRITQEFQTLSEILSAAFGGKKSKSQTPRNFEEAEAQFKALFGTMP